MAIWFNINGVDTPDLPYLKDITRRCNPGWQLVMDNPGLAVDLDNLTTGHTVLRMWPDDDRPRSKSPYETIRMGKEVIGSRPLWWYANNESGTPWQWLLETARRAVQEKQPTVFGNFATGSWKPEDWENPAALEFLKLAAMYPQYIVIGFHEYAGGAITSGLIGGHPEMWGLIDPANWPTRETIDSIVCWHMRRFMFVVKTCDKYGLKPYPRMLVTEWGFDDTTDIATWLQGLIHAARVMGAANVRTEMLIMAYRALFRLAPLLQKMYNTFEAPHKIRGWRTLEKQWAEWWPQFGGDAEAAYWFQSEFADRVYYAGTPVETQLWFTWSSNPDWANFWVHNAPRLISKLVAHYEQSVPPVEPPPVEPPDYPDLEAALAHVNRRIDLVADRVAAAEAASAAHMQQPHIVGVDWANAQE